MKTDLLRLENVVLLACALPLLAQAADKPKMATDIPVAITTPNEQKTRLGTLKFSDGRPDKATAAKLYDNIDFQRGVQAFMSTNAAASMVAMREGLRSAGADDQTSIIWETLTDSKSLLLATNTETVYVTTWLDTSNGPLVIETPPNFLGITNDFWQRYVGDMGNAGPDRGKGGKFLLLPPGYDVAVPEGYFVLRSRTFGNWVAGRAFVVNGDPKPAADNIKKYWRVYPLAQAANPPETKFANASGKFLNTINASDFSYFEELNQVVQSEPIESIDPETRGLLAAIGMQKGKQFAPDARMKKILTEAAAVGDATNRAIFWETRNPVSYFYPGSNWREGFIGSSHVFAPGGILDVEARSLYFFGYIGTTPAMAMKMVGIGSQYAYASKDANKALLDGSKRYKLHLPAGIPAKNFWSIIVYDTQTRSYLQTDQQFPSVGNVRPGVIVNPDTSVDIYFGPKPPAGKEVNWIQTLPGKGWWTMLRLYGPLEPWFDKTWKPGEIELLK